MLVAGADVEYRDGFTGCIRALLLNGKHVDLMSYAKKGLYGTFVVTTCSVCTTVVSALSCIYCTECVLTVIVLVPELLAIVCISPVDKWNSGFFLLLEKKKIPYTESLELKASLYNLPKLTIITCLLLIGLGFNCWMWAGSCF